jgi:hypothetical protein
MTRLSAWIPLLLLLTLSLPSFLWFLGRPTIYDDEGMHAEIPR